MKIRLTVQIVVWRRRSKDFLKHEGVLRLPHIELKLLAWQEHPRPSAKMHVANLPFVIYCTCLLLVWLEKHPLETCKICIPLLIWTPSKVAPARSGCTNHANPLLGPTAQTRAEMSSAWRPCILIQVWNRARRRKEGKRGGRENKRATEASNEEESCHKKKRIFFHSKVLVWHFLPSAFALIHSAANKHTHPKLFSYLTQGGSCSVTYGFFLLVRVSLVSIGISISSLFF